MTADPKILDRIKKLLALATSSNPHEAGLALQRAQELMQAHQVSEATVELGVLSEVEVSSIATATRVKIWELRLMDGVAKAFGLELLFRRGYPYGGYIFFGPETDVKVAEYAATFLLRRIAKDRAAFTRGLSAKMKYDFETNTQRYMTRKEKSGEVDAFCDGWVTTVLTKVGHLARPQHQAKMITEQAAERFTKPSNKRLELQQNRGSLASHQLGKEMASDVSLNRPVHGQASSTKQLGGRS